MLVARKLKNFNVSHPKTWNLIGKTPYLPVADFRPRILYSSQNFLLYDWPTLVKSHLFIITWLFIKNQNTAVGKQNGINNCSQSSVKLRLLGLPHMLKTGPELVLLPQRFKSGRSLIHTVILNGNQMSLLAGFSNKALLRL